MYICLEEEVFKFFLEEVYILDGMFILILGGLKGDGIFDWEMVMMVFSLFFFGVFSFIVDIIVVKIKMQDLDDIVLEIINV